MRHHDRAAHADAISARLAADSLGCRFRLSTQASYRPHADTVGSAAARLPTPLTWREIDGLTEGVQEERQRGSTARRRVPKGACGRAGAAVFRTSRCVRCQAGGETEAARRSCACKLGPEQRAWQRLEPGRSPTRHHRRIAHQQHTDDGAERYPGRLKTLPRALLWAELASAAAASCLGLAACLTPDAPTRAEDGGSSAATGSFRNAAASSTAALTFLLHTFRQAIYLTPGQGRREPRSRRADRVSVRSV